MTPDPAEPIFPIPDNRLYLAGQDVQVLEGQSFSLNFTVAEERDDIVYTWETPTGSVTLGQSAGSNVEFVASSRLLVVMGAVLDNEGRYRLIARNEAGRDRIISQVSVFGEKIYVGFICIVASHLSFFLMFNERYNGSQPNHFRARSYLYNDSVNCATDNLGSCF